MLSCSVARVATTRLAARAGCQHAAAASSSSSSSSAAAAGWQQMQPAAVASRVVMTPTISRMGWTPARGIAGPSASTSHTAANKGARSKRTGADAQQDALEHDVEREANQTAEVTTQDVAAQAAAKKAAREAKKAKKAGTVQAEKLSESEQRRIKKEAQKAASQRADQKFKASVIEKEVPLMDLTGIKPGQNMVRAQRNVLHPVEVH
jgi:hypothetical protein